MSIKQKLPKFLKENQLSKKSPTLYHTYYKIGNYEYFPQQSKHILTIVSEFHANQREYKLEKEGDLHPELLKCLQNREEIVYFWSHKKLNLSEPFSFAGEDYYWTIFPREAFIETHNAQKWLDKNFPVKKRDKETKIRTNWWIDLQGDLDLSDFINLKELDCSNNQLTSLKISDNSPIEKLNCSNNSLTDIDLLLCKLSSENLKELDLANNKFSESNLTPFSKFINLEVLSIANNNDFFGSLGPLKSLTKLRELDISNTNIDSGLEFLTNNLEEFKCYDASSKGQKTKSTTELYEKELHSFNSNIQTWREFYDSPTQKWLDQNYPEDKKNQDENLDEEEFIGLASCPSVIQEESIQRSKIDILDISLRKLHETESLKENEYLEEALRLKGFTELKKLNCSDNKLTNLNLYDCSKLTELDISNNQFNNLEFLSFATELERLWIANNQKLFPQNLEIFLLLKNLKELDIRNCPFEGSLEPLKNLTNLENLNITNTNLNEGLEHLPENCKKIFCNSDYQYKSAKIMKELDKSSIWEEGKHYNLDKWREDKTNKVISSVIPLERLFVIRSNLKKFVSKWGIKEKKPESNNDWSWHAKFSNLMKEQEEGNVSELSKLQSPEQFNKHWYWTVPQWTGRGAVGISGILSFYGYQVGAVAVASPIIETITSYAKQNWYENKEKAWEEFVKDSEELLDNYHELKGIIENIQTPFAFGKVYSMLTELNEKIKVFLEKYDKIEKDGTIDIFELQKGKAELAEDLNKEQKGKEDSQLGNIVRAMLELEKEINNYRQGFSSDKKKKKKRNKQQDETQESILDDIFINVENFDQEISENGSQIGNVSDANSFTPILGSQDKKSLSVFSNLAKRKKILSHSKTSEAYELQEQEQIAETLHVPLPGSSSSK